MSGVIETKQKITSSGSIGYTPEDVANKVTAFQVTPDNTHYPSEKLVKDYVDPLITRNTIRNSAGWVSGGRLSTTIDNLLLNVAAGVGIAFDGVDFAEVIWDNFSNIPYVAMTYNFVAIKYDGTLSVTASEIISNQYIRLGKFWWDPVAGIITVVWNTPLIVGNYQYVMDNYLGTSVGATVVGLTVSEKASPDYRQLIFSEGVMTVRLSPFPFNESSRFVKILQCIDFYVARDVINDNNTVDTTLWADKTKTAATALTEMTTGYWAKALIVINTQGLYYYVYPEAEFATEDEAKSAALPLVTALLADDNACVCMIVFKKGDISIANRIYDIRPNFQRVFGTELFAAGGASVSHNATLGRDATNCHPAASITTDSTHEYVTDAEKTIWNAKLSAGAISVSFSPSAPTNISSGTKMFGLGSTLTFTPAKNGKVLFFMNFNPSGTGTASGMSSYRPAYGTGAAPINGAAATGTVFDIAVSGSNYSASVSTPSVTHTFCWIISGLTPGTPYWFDVQGTKPSGATGVGMSSIKCSLMELLY
jgi:hypothetical protein